MKALLKIPFNEKDNAKQIAKDNHCALFYSSNKYWELNCNTIPTELQKYVFKIEEDNKIEIKVTQKSKISNTEYNYVLDIPFMLRNGLSNYGGFYNSEFKVYVVKTKVLNKDLESFRSRPYSYEAYIEKKLNNNNYKEQVSNTEDVIIPRDYQIEAYKTIISAREKLDGFLLADEVGLGKTISAGLVAKEKDFSKILVVTTLSAVAHWRKTFLRMNINDNKEVIIINYDRLQKLVIMNDKKYKTPAKTKKTKNKRLAKSGDAPDFDLIIWDESHKMKNNTSMRSKLGLKLASNADFNLYLSATAGQSPLELSYLVLLLSQITGQSVSSMVEFEKWCKSMDLGVSRAEFGKWVWDGSQASIEKVHSLLFKGKPQAALRRTPGDIVGYPEITRELTPLELSPEEIGQYKLIWHEFRETMNGLSGNKQKNGVENSLVAQLRLRQKASLLKIPYTIEYIVDLLEKGQQVAVSVGFKETMFEIEKLLLTSKITCSKIYGGLNGTEKENERLKFQKGENKVVLFTVEEAISLHQGEYNNFPRTMLIHDLRWSAISMSQIEGRTHRDGRFSQIHWLYFVNTIEEDIANIVLNRVISMKGMIGDDTKVLKEIEAILSGKLHIY
jgi:hypothetical protein